MVLVAMAGLEPAMTRLKDGRLSRLVHIAENFGGAYENRTRLNDARVKLAARIDSNHRYQLSETCVLPLDDLPVNGVTGENRTLVERSTVARLIRSATVTIWSQMGSRNPDLRVTSAALFHLSYSGMERVRRIELR